MYIYIHIFTYSHIHIFIYSYVHMFTCSYVHIHIHIHVHLHINTHIHIYTYICIYRIYRLKRAKGCLVAWLGKCLAPGKGTASIFKAWRKDVDRTDTVRTCQN